jgi:uncharacterized protein YukE
MDISDKSPNKTLSSEVTRDIVKRAKEAGVNVSGIISQLQRALAAQGNEGNTANDFESTYKKLFKAMRRIMHPYRVMVEIGNDNSCPLGDPRTNNPNSGGDSHLRSRPILWGSL